MVKCELKFSSPALYEYNPENSSKNRCKVNQESFRIFSLKYSPDRKLHSSTRFGLVIKQTSRSTSTASICKENPKLSFFFILFNLFIIQKHTTWLFPITQKIERREEEKSLRNFLLSLKSGGKIPQQIVDESSDICFWLKNHNDGNKRRRKNNNNDDDNGKIRQDVKKGKCIKFAKWRENIISVALGRKEVGAL